MIIFQPNVTLLKSSTLNHPMYSVDDDACLAHCKTFNEKYGAGKCKHKHDNTTIISVKVINSIPIIDIITSCCPEFKEELKNLFPQKQTNDHRKRS
ncbi:MAG: hypothetical protein HY841_14560 [Bacteroidetes bacterium]|nr:hypothetical protein [Bacteroidota bacterium]